MDDTNTMAAAMLAMHSNQAPHTHSVHCGSFVPQPPALCGQVRLCSTILDPQLAVSLPHLVTTGHYSLTVCPFSPSGVGKEEPVAACTALPPPFGGH